MSFQRLIKTVIFLATIIWGAILTAAGDPKIIDLQFASEKVEIGQSIQLKCILQDVDSQYTIAFYKQGIDPDNDEQTKWFQLAEDDRADYPGSPYSFWKNKNAAIFDYMMRVQSAEVAMSGNYSCVIKSSATSEVVANKTAEVYVVVEPTSVKLYVDGQEIEQNSTRLYNYSSIHNLQCVASGSNPASRIDIWHGNQDLTRRATHLTVSKPVYSKPTLSNLPFLSTISRSVNLTIANWRVDVTYHVAELKCLAKAGDQSLGRIAKFTPVVEDGPPHFICNDSYIVPETGNQDDGHDIVCRVVAKPALTDAKIGCEPSSMCKAFSLYPIHEWHPASDTVFSGAIQNTDVASSQNPKDIIQGTMTLRIKMKRQDIIGRSYAFTAENSRGQAYHKVTLVGGGVSVLASMTLCFMTVVISLLLV